MFTGIIEEIGNIIAIKKENNSAYIKIGASTVLDGTKIGDSIAVNGACQTVIKMGDDWFDVFSSYETLSLTTLGNIKIGDKVNLERALRLCDRLGGHLVSGHVDTIGEFCSKKQKGEAFELIFKARAEQMDQIAQKGSITIDGISLTVAEVLDDNKFSCAVIPHTIENTTLKYLKAGDKINLETDLLSKYVEKYLLSNDNEKATTINIELLERNGFL